MAKAPGRSPAPASAHANASINIHPRDYRVDYVYPADAQEFLCVMNSEGWELFTAQIESSGLRWSFIHHRSRRAPIDLNQ